MLWQSTFCRDGPTHRSPRSNTVRFRPGSESFPPRAQSGASVRKIHGVLSAILDLAVRDKRIPANPANGVSLPRVKARRRQYLTADEVEQLAAEASRPPATRAESKLAAAYRAYGLAVLVLAYCGLRWSELAALRAEHVDLLRRRLNICEAVTEINGGALAWGTPKSHEARSVPLPGFLLDGLPAHLADRVKGDLVFSTVNGDVLRNRNARSPRTCCTRCAAWAPSQAPASRGRLPIVHASAVAAGLALSR